MSWSDREALAADYVLGTLDPTARQEVDAALASDSELRDLVEAWERRLAPLAVAVPAVTPPAALFAQIETEIERLDQGPPGTVTVRARGGRWRTLAPGVETKLLSVDRKLGRRSFLLRLAPGACLPAHEHAKGEESLLLEGDLRFGELQLRPGDYQYVPAGTPHPAGFSDRGCIAFVSIGI